MAYNTVQRSTASHTPHPKGLTVKLSLPNTASTVIALAITLAAALTGCGESGPSTTPASSTTPANPPANQPSEAATPVQANTNTNNTTPAADTSKVDPNLYDYTKTDGVSGRIASVGSDTMNNLMTLWTQGFKRYYPNVNEEIEGKGSSTAPQALIQRRADFGPMSREMKSSEQDKFKQRFGYEAMQLAVAIDTIAVFVHKDNPVQGLSLPQLDAIFSKNRKGGHGQEITRWGQVGLTGDWADLTISLFGRNSASGTYGYFKDVALYGGDYKDTVKEQPGSSAVVQGVARDRRGIGYSGIGYKTPDVRIVPLAAEDGGPYIEPDSQTALDGTYPLARPLLLTVNYEPNSDLDPLRREFIKYILSKQGQAEVVKDGYYPVPATVARQMLEDLNIPWPGK